MLTQLLSAGRRLSGILAVAALSTAAVGALRVPAGASAGDASAIAGHWVGTSYDVTYDIPGDLTADFSATGKSTFDGTVNAVYPPPDPGETCAVNGGSLASDGHFRASAICRAVGYASPEAATLDAQLSADGTTLTGPSGARRMTSASSS